jgi:hypothetical protein
LDTYTTINASGKINPVPIGSLHIFAWAFMDASDWTSVYAVSDTFTNISNNGVRHFLDSLVFGSAISSLAGEWAGLFHSLLCDICQEDNLAQRRKDAKKNHGFRTEDAKNIG